MKFMFERRRSHALTVCQRSIVNCSLKWICGATLGLLVLPSPASAQDPENRLTLSVTWTKDETVSPPLQVCSQSGELGAKGYVDIHLRFQPPSNLWYSPGPTVTQMVIHEACGHNPDEIRNNAGGFSGSPIACCSDPTTGYMFHDEAWDTHVWHNGDHTLTATVVYSTYASGYPPVVTQHTISKSITVTVKNLVITPTQPANPDPILWDPANGPITLQASVTAAYRAVQPVKLTIYDSTQSQINQLTQNVAVGNGATTVSFTWDGTEYGPPTIAPKGVYLFKWDVGPYSYNNDFDSDKATLLAVTQVKTDLTGAYDDTTDQSTVLDSCWLTDSDTPRADATVDHVRVYDENLAVISGPNTMGLITNPPGAPTPTWNTAQFLMVLRGQETHLVSSKDNHSAKDKDHRQRWAVQKGTKVVRPLADNYAEITTAGNVDKTCASWQKKLWDSATNYRGAYDAHANGAASAAFIMTQLPKDHLMHFWGHGNATGGGVATSTTMIWAKPAPGQTGNFISAVSLADMLLVVWQGCDTANTDPVNGNLLTQSVTQGAQCAVGFTTSILFENFAGGVNRIWADAFWHDLAQGVTGTGVPATVQASLIYARDQVYAYTGNTSYDGYDSFSTAGNNGLKVVPAR